MSIAQFGSTRSINAGAAAAIAMHAWIRQHVFSQPSRARRTACTQGRSGARVGGDVWQAQGGDTDERSPVHHPHDRSPHAHRNPRGLRRDARQGQGRARSPSRPINVTSSQTLQRGAPRLRRGRVATASSRSRPVAREFLSGTTIKDMVAGSVALRGVRPRGREEVPVNIALHTDHCPKDKLDGFVRPLLAVSQERVDARRAAALPVAHVGRLRRAARGEPRDRRRSCWSAPRPPRSSSRSRSASSAAKRTASSARSTTSSTPPPRTRSRTVEALGTGENGRYMTALTFGNVHGVYKPGNVKLRPEILKDIQDAVGEKLGLRPAPSRSTWSSTAAPAPCRRRSATPSTTA